MPEIGVTRIDGKRWALEIDVDSVEAILGNNTGDRRDEIRHTLRIGEGEVLSASAKRNHDLLSVAFEEGDVGFKLRSVQTSGCVELHRAFRRILIRGSESHENDIPLWRDVAHRESGPGRAVAGPVSDQFVTVRRACRWGSERWWV